MNHCYCLFFHSVNNHVIPSCKPKSKQNAIFEIYKNASGKYDRKREIFMPNLIVAELIVELLI